MHWTITELVKTGDGRAIDVAYEIRETAGGPVLTALSGIKRIGVELGKTAAQHRAVAVASIEAVCRTELDRRNHEAKADELLAAATLPITGTVT